MQSSEENKSRTDLIVKAAEKTSRLEITGKARPYREIKELHKQLGIIREAYKGLIYSREQITPAYEWLYDNYYILEREGRLVIKELWKCRPLPVSGSEPLVFIHAKAFCESSAGGIDARTMELYIESAQKIRSFESGELSVMGLMLRSALICAAARACSKDIDDQKRAMLFSDAVKTLNFLNTFDFSQIVEKQSRIEKILSRDPAGVYTKMDERTRALYRSRIARLAEKRHMDEAKAAELAVKLACEGKTPRERHIGHYILDMNIDRPYSNTRGNLYFILSAAIPAVLSVFLGILLRVPWIALLLFLPLWEIVKPILDYFILKGVPVNLLPRMELEGVIPEEAPTLVVLSALLTSPQKSEEFAKKLEQFYYSNGRGQITFGVLADLKQSRFPDKPEDKAIVTAAVKQIRMLNRKYGGGFCLFIRGRRYSATQGEFSGWERKRGAIIELIRLIKGHETSISTFEGDLSAVRKTRYVITLDSDTGLLMDTAAEMVSAAIHPLNVPEVHDGIVTAGYGILAPRIGVNLESAAITPFSRIMAGAGGVTAYDNASGDIYQDIFGEGIFAGKGIIDVNAFYDVMDNLLPENRVLSHDILEGCFLRAGFLSDVELTDGFPAHPVTWFDRLHRWIRGDWQNISFIGKKTPCGSKTKLNALSRFKLFDNLRRSVTPVAAFACLIAAAFMNTWPAVTLILAAFLSLAGAGLLSALVEVIHGGPSMLSRKYHCRVFPQAINSIAQGALAYLFLPYHAICAADAVIRALWRLKTRKNLLEWVTAAESESQKAVRNNTLMISLRRFWPSFIFGFLFLFLALQPAAKFAGAFFIITPFVAWMSGRPTPPIRDDMSDDDTERLRSYTAAMWRYFDDYVTKRDNYLPPDNLQEAPVSVIAHRTSPTNIGLLLLSTLAARDLKLIDSETMFDRLRKTVSTIEKMEKWRGHLYNWYDTRSLKPMKPEYVSTVDSGNLLCCLVTLREGIKDYVYDDKNAAELCSRITAITDKTDLNILYNKRRRLFYLGYDIERDKPTEIYYDLLMSEARMTSYYAVAKRIVPKRHWGALGRTLTRQNGYTGPVSWTGTMFEYMMPHLLLPVYEDSMAAETMRFVIYCQQKRVKASGVPWGISESGFYSFDAALNYQYEAHGVQKLALKRGMDDQLVISPYSTFLALPFCRNSGMKNLKRLEDMGMYGRCGFYEAADFSYKRTGGRMAVVKSYMAHHVGMSLVAADNALFDGIMQERFMRDHEMRSAKDLLCEKIPADAVVFNDVLKREIPEKPGRYGIVRENFDVVNPVSPRVNAVSNGEYTMVLTDCGASMSIFHGVDVTRRSTDLLRAPSGIFTAAAFGEEKICVSAAPEYAEQTLVRRHVEFNSRGAVYHARTQDYGICVQALLNSGMPCEIRAAELENFTQKRVDAKLLFYFEPSLAKAADEQAHPAFSRLFLRADYHPDTRVIVFSRRARTAEIPTCIAVGFVEQDVRFEFESDRPSLLERPYGISSLLHALDVPFGNGGGAIPEAAAAIRVKTVIPQRSKKHFTLIIAAANNAEEAQARFIEARNLNLHGLIKTAACNDSGVMETRLAAIVMPEILFPAADMGKMPEGLLPYASGIRQAACRNTLGQQGLWQLGISGDLPVILFHYEGKSSAERLESYVKMHKELRLKGIQFDLAVTYLEGGDYARSKHSDIIDRIRICGCDYLCGSRGGIHIINMGLIQEDVKLLLISTACHIASEAITRQTPKHFYAADFLAASPAKTDKVDIRTYGGGFSGEKFIISHNGENPVVPWSHILASPSFGTLVTDRALGFTWAVNARENKLTPWSNDTMSDLRGEMLIVKIGRHFFDLCLNSRVTYTPSSAEYESEAEGIRFKVKVFIPGAFTAKIVLLEAENTSEKEIHADAAYYTEPVLSVSPVTRRYVSISENDGNVFMANPWSQVKGCSFLTALEGYDAFVSSRERFLSGNWKHEKEISYPDPCAALIKHLTLEPGKTEKINFVLGFSGEEGAARAEISLIKKSISQNITEKRRMAPVVKVNTPDARFDVMVNTWLPAQFMNSRIYGRTGFYQCGGAWGFRDQLQDACAAIYTDPSFTRAHIYRCAAHQFRQGDVLHWWHQLPPRDGGSKGVRTRCSDDMLWLPYTVCVYTEKTGDYSILEHEIYYLDGPELERTEEDRYFAPKRSDEKESVYLHCVRAIERAATSGRHGIPLFGTGDWNDGMNLVGAGGAGESVWLAMFLTIVLRKFSVVAKHMKDEEKASKYELEVDRLIKSVDESCWNGEWYLRGFYDDGGVLGGHECGECRIDMLPQAFSSICAVPDKAKREKALDSMVKILADRRLKLVRLFRPPFDSGGRNPGYIRSYSPGLRENGGQYTHAAVWGALGLLCAGRAEEAGTILSWINPAYRTEQAEQARIYRLEPYAVAADIYTNPSCEGRGGWSLYTGAAGWFYRTAVEYMLGIKINSGVIKVDPCIPPDWDGFKASIFVKGAEISVEVKKGEKSLVVDGEKADVIPADGKNHIVQVFI